jgi:hypothetical protein
MRNNETTKEGTKECARYGVIHFAIREIGAALESYNGAITAIATMFIAWFTLSLRQSTDKLWLAAQSESEAAEFHRNVQYEQTSEQIEALKQSADAAEQAARASVDQAHASAVQAKIAENALIQLERPYIFIFGIRQVKQDADSSDFFVEYSVVNYGKMPAIIEGAWIDFVPDNKGEPPIPTLLDESHSLLSSPIFQAGERRDNIRAYVPFGMIGGSCGVIINTKTGVEAVCPNFIVSEGFDMYFRGTISYRGPSSEGHETGALWLYNPSTFEFAQRGGNEYNYTK